MTPVLSGSIRARKRVAAVLFVFFAELAWALLVATPAHAWARRVWGSHPYGDDVLFYPGGRDLMMWLGQEDAALPVTVRTMMVLLVVGAVVMQLPLGALIASLAFSRDDATDPLDAKDATKGGALSTLASLRIGIGAMLPLAALLALGTVAAVIVIALGVLASGAVDHGLAESLGDARAFQLRLVVLALFLAIAAVIGVFVDLARVAVGREVGLAAIRGTTASAWTMMLRGVKVALTTSRRALGRATLAWALRAAVGALLIGAGYAVAQELGGRGGYALVALFVVHQAVVLVRVGLRASWLACALGFVAPVQDQPAAAPAPAATSER